MKVQWLNEKKNQKNIFQSRKILCEISHFSRCENFPFSFDYNGNKSAKILSTHEIVQA